jgi:hypothetical protein
MRFEPSSHPSCFAAPGRIETMLTLNLPAGKYSAEWIDTKTGQTAHADQLDHATGAARLKAPRSRTTSP